MENKLFKNSVSILLVLVMVMSVFGVITMFDGDSAYAETNSDVMAATTDKSAATLSEVDKALNIKAQDISAKSYGSIIVTNRATGTEAVEDAYVAASAIPGRTGYAGYSQAYTAPDKGMIVIGAAATGKSVTYGLFYDAEMTKAVHSTTSSSSYASRAFKVPSAGTYYIGAYAYNLPVGTTINMAAAYTSGGDRTIVPGQQYAVGMSDAQSNYFAIKATQTGYLQVNAGEYANVSLYSSSKKALSNTTSTSYLPTYGVKKGNTYYVKVDMGYISYFSKYGYLLQVNNVKITEKSGKKRTKAKTIKKKKTKKGTIIAGSSQADWYKVKLTSKKKLTVTMKGATNSGLKLTIYDKKGKKLSGASTTFRYYSKSVGLKSYSKLPKGTYYIKVSRADKKSSGWYSLKWK